MAADSVLTTEGRIGFVMKGDLLKKLMDHINVYRKIRLFKIIKQPNIHMCSLAENTTIDDIGNIVERFKGLEAFTPVIYGNAFMRFGSLWIRLNPLPKKITDVITKDIGIVNFTPCFRFCQVQCSKDVTEQDKELFLAYVNQFLSSHHSRKLNEVSRISFSHYVPETILWHHSFRE